MKYAIFAISSGGKKLAAEITQNFDASVIEISDGIQQAITKRWHQVSGLICIMSTGIVVRSIAPLLGNKHKDPAVVVLDQKGTHVISLLSGHLGGANELAQQIARITGGKAVITTASDTLDLVPLDIWAQHQELSVQKEDMIQASALLVNQGKLFIYSEVPVESLPPGLHACDREEDCDVIISSRRIVGRLVFHPKNIVIGTGCNRNTPEQEFKEALDEFLDDLQISLHAIRNLSSIDLKNDETGLLDFAKTNVWPIDFYNRNEINTLDNIEVSSAAMKAVGAIGVAEPCAILSASPAGGQYSDTENVSIQLLSRKRKWKNITMAMAQAPFTLSAQVQAP